MQSHPALEIRDLRKTYDNGVEALKGVSLQVEEGDFYALLGPNGAGKSTLIGIVSSLVNKSEGEVKVFGVDLQAERSRAMRLIGHLRAPDRLHRRRAVRSVPRPQPIRRSGPQHRPVGRLAGIGS